MKKSTITFEITAGTTEVIAFGLNGISEKFDITGTEEEKDFIALLKKLRNFQLAKKITSALDIDTWQEVKSS